jgi:hypothetical protein
MEEFGVKKSKKVMPSITEILEEQSFKIIVYATVPYVNYYTKQEFLNRIQSQSSWNLVKESQRSAILKKIDQYLETVLDKQGRIEKKGNVTVVLAQKIKEESKSIQN